MKNIALFTITCFGLISCNPNTNNDNKVNDEISSKIEFLERKVDSLVILSQPEKVAETLIEESPEKIRKSVGASSPYRFNGKNEWSQLADLIATIEVNKKSDFIVSYSVASWRNCRIEGSYVCTRLLVDGKEVRSFRQCGEGDYPSTSSMDIIELAKGKHTVKVQYLSPMSCSTNDNNPNYGSKFMGRNLTVREL